jgi:hypothetical protein
VVDLLTMQISLFPSNFIPADSFRLCDSKCIILMLSNGNGQAVDDMDGVGLAAPIHLRTAIRHKDGCYLRKVG